MTIHPANLTAVTPRPTSGSRVRGDVVTEPPRSVHAPYTDRLDPFWDRPVWADTPRMYARKRWDWPKDPTLDVATMHTVDHFADPDDDGHRSGWRLLVNSDKAHQAIAVLHAFGHLDAKQLCAWIGIDARNTSRYLKKLFDFGIVQRGTFNPYARIGGSFPYLYSLHDGKPLRRYLRAIGRDRARQIMGTPNGLPKLTTRHIHHNVTVVEAALRIFETSDRWAAVAGEHGATIAKMLPDHTFEELSPRMGADAVLIRNDGLQVALEVAASADRRHLRSKIAQWTRLLASLSDRDNLVVVWVNAVTADHEKAAQTLRNLYTSVVHSTQLQTFDHLPLSPTQVRRVQQRMFVASWADWFPAPRTVSTVAVDLTCGFNKQGEQWTPIALADPASYPAPAVPPPWPSVDLVPHFAHNPVHAHAG